MSKPENTIRVAVVQFHAGDDVDANLATCLEWLDKTMECEPDLVVLPEFANHLSWYDDKQHCFDVSVALDGPFLSAIAAKAKELGIHVVVNCTVQRDDGTATGSSLLYSPEGELLADNTKQIYIGHENDFLEKADCEGPVVETDLGRIGLYACMDGVINETPRCLALNGAQVMLNSLNSFATDEASLPPIKTDARRDGTVIADGKALPNIHYLPALIECYPKSRFVHVVRDLRGVHLSQTAKWRRKGNKKHQGWFHRLVHRNPVVNGSDSATNSVGHPNADYGLASC